PSFVTTPPVDEDLRERLIQLSEKKSSSTLSSKRAVSQKPLLPSLSTPRLDLTKVKLVPSPRNDDVDEAENGLA
ncbi:MAG: hypothetical protein ACTHJ4_03550, partial [Candidatus Nucleicultricaceae bacterium]